MSPPVLLRLSSIALAFATAAGDEAETKAETLPSCPPAFALDAVYVTGEKRESRGEVFQCNPDYGGAYQRYCNIPRWDDDLMVEDERFLWEQAWVHVGPCDPRERAKGGNVDGGAGATRDDGGGEGTRPAEDTGAGACAADGVECTAEAPPPCPPPFDRRDTYVAGELREAGGIVYQCNPAEGYERWCNVPDWDESLLEEDGRAKEMWDEAWLYRGPCRRSASREEEAEAADGAEGAARDAQALPSCPLPFDRGATYVAGELREAEGNAYQCNPAEGGAYEKYCNIPDWDDRLLDEDENAREMLYGAWLHRGPCRRSTSREEFPEEEARTPVVEGGKRDPLMASSNGDDDDD